MAAPRIVLDGTQAYGSRTLTIGGVAYKANNIKVARPHTDAKDEDTNGTPGRARYTADRAVLTAELQLATSSTAYPVFGTTFSATFDSAAYGSETFVVMPVEQEEDNGEGNIRKFTLVANLVVNSITTVA